MARVIMNNADGRGFGSVNAPSGPSKVGAKLEGRGQRSEIRPPTGEMMGGTRHAPTKIIRGNYCGRAKKGTGN